MPRLDNSNEELQEWYEYRFNWDDPGDTGPVDVCISCYKSLWKDEVVEIDHPPYEDDPDYPYRCMECEELLTNEDN